MKKRINSISAIALYIAAAFFISGTSLSAEFKFREFKADREKFEKYTDNAEKSISEQEWQNILDSGKQEMQAEWERSARSEMERYIRQGGDASEVRISMEESRGEWESEYERSESRAKGSWFVKRENLIFDSVDFSLLKKSVIDAGSDNTLTSAEAWDSYIGGTLSDVNISWDIKFLPLIENIKIGGKLLTGDVKTGFDMELASFENELKRKFEVERNTIVYTGRNAFITELYIDTESLKYQSAQESADVSTGNLIKEVQESLKSEEDKILTKNYNSEGVSTLDLSVLGDNWEEQLKQLVNTGMEKWNGALDRLYRQMLSWKDGALDAYETAESLWRKAAEKLEQARSEWEIKLGREIYEALDNWQREENELYSNIDTARKDFSEYMSNLSLQWRDHSSGLIDMAVNGSKVYTESLDNIKWLEKMCVENEKNGQGAFGRKGEVKYQDAEFYSIIDTTDRDIIDGTISGLPKSFIFNGIDYGFIFPIEGSIYYIGGYYTYEYAGATGKQDSDDNWYMTENYTVKIYGKAKTYTALPDYYSWGNQTTKYDWVESDVLVKTFTATNDVTKDSPDKEKSTYYYYKTELERWKNIRDSFSGIAAEAEAYMHEKNMLGEQGGPGYLTNSGGSDPYLMTDAEFSLQVASRDKDFWQKRLDIAKAVLDYAEKTKGQDAATTESNKIAAEDKMKTAKLLYEKTLGEVDDIVEKLKVLQGQKPSGERNSSNETLWLAYLGSIEYLTAEYSKANAVLQTADKDYAVRKESLILLENNENSDYLLKEIHQIEKNILQTDREIYQKQIELYKKQFESEYSERTAGFARNYETAAKSYEESKLKFNILKNILTGEENDAALVTWGNAIVNAKDLLWEEDGDQYSGIINNLVKDYTPEKRELLSSAIRNTYYNFQFNMESAEFIITKLRDSTFNPDAFIENENGTDHAAYIKYAQTSVKALDIIDEAMNVAENNGNKNYSTIADWLRTEFEKERYIYGTDNSSFIEHYTALKYFEDRYKGLTAEAWESTRDRLESEIRFAVKASELHNDFSALSPEELASMISENEIKASIGDMDAVAILREYYMSGSGIAGLEYIDDFDRSAEKIYNLNESLKVYVYENYRYFQNGQSLLAGHSYLDDMLGYINSVVSLASGSGENLLTAEDFKTLTPESLSIAAGSIKDFIIKLDSDNIPIPDFLMTAADLIQGAKERLDAGLFIRRYMTNDSSDEMAGSVDDVYARKLKEAQGLQVVTEFINYCGEKLETGIGDDYTLAMSMIAEYETLSEGNKKYLKDHEDEKINAVNQFIENLYLYRYTINLNNLALQYDVTEVSVTPDQFILDKGLNDVDRDKLLTIIKPLYERRIFDNGYKDGSIPDINKYISDRISSGKISNKEGEVLKAYAVINEYLYRASGENLTSNDPAFAEYIKYKNFESYILTISRDSGDTDEEYAEKCANAYYGAHGGDLDEFTDFAESFIVKELTSFKYLDKDAKIYAASKYYYDEMFARNKVPVNGIENFLEDKFGEESITGDVIDAVTAYAGRLNTVSFYYGSDLNKYTENMGVAVKDYFLMYINGVSEAILPGFEYGIYETGSAEGGVVIELGKLTGELNRYTSGFSELEKITNKYNEMAEAGIKNTDALKALYASGEQGKNWRGDMLAIIEGDVLVTPVPVINLTEWADSYDGTSGLRNTVVYSNMPLTRDGKTFSVNGIIDDMNIISSLLNSLGEAIKQDFIPESTLGITSFLQETDKHYNMGNSYSVENGEFSFEALLRGAVSGYEAISENRIYEVSDLKGTLSGMDSNLQNIKSTFLSKKTSFNLLVGGKSKETLLEELESSRVIHEKAKREVEDLRQKLSDARTVYEDTNTNYVKKMNLVSDTYSAYKGFEFDYEKAYSIWEYAKTPYLQENKTDSGNLETGQTPSGGSTNYGDIPVPDARDNYLRILSKFNQSLEVYNEKALAVTNQDTIEKLNADAEYAKLKADFIRKSESYIRAAQVDTEIKEDLEKYKQQYNVSKQIYGNAKNNFTPYSLKLNELAGESETLKKALAQQRDQILAHILKIGGTVNSTAIIDMYMNGLSWYSCVKSNIYCTESIKNKNEEIAALRSMGYPMSHGRIAELQSGISDLYTKIAVNNGYVAGYNALTDEVKADIKKLYESFTTSNAGDNLTVISERYHQYTYDLYRYNYARQQYRSTSKWKVIKRRYWKRKSQNRYEDYITHFNSYEIAINPIKNSLLQAAKDKTDFAEKTSTLNRISSARTLAEVKEYLKLEKYNLTDEDLSHLYDSSNNGLADDKEGINLDLLRIQNETLRTDIDGETVYADLDGDIVTVLDKDGKPQFDKNGKPVEVYQKDDPSIRLELKDGKYVVYDRTYDISAIVGILKEQSKKYREEYQSKLMSYIRDEIADGARDNTVVLQDLENVYHKLQEFAENFNLTGDPNGEKRQRGLDGYVAITKEYVNNGNKESIQGMIMEALMKQSSALQNQLWQQQIEKFQERKTRWNEVTGYILNRGMAEWRENYSEFKNLWTKWRFDAKKMITEGENWWAAEAGTMTQNMTLWSEETSKAASKEAAQQIYNELDGRISRYEADLKKKMPGNASFEINTDKILSQAMKNRPIDSIGILTQTMHSTDTTAGFTNLLNLGLSGTLFKYNEEQMEEYTNAMGVMKNLQLIDILNSIIEGFNKQLTEANRNVYEGVDTKIRRNETFGVAPFNRREGENIWDIRVCVASNLTGDKFKTRRFIDYGNYINSTVYFQPIKGLDGTTIDFNQASTYSNIDGEDLEVFVGLESEWLNRKIEGVFGSEGTFSTHQQKEYTRLYGSFGEYYGDWQAGKALQGAGFYAKPMFPHGPNMMQTAVMVAGVAGGPWAAFAVSMLTTGVQVSDGSMSWKQGAFNVGMSAATACIGVGASELSGMVGGAAVEAGNRTMTQIAVGNVSRTAANTLVSGVRLEGGSLGYDKDRMTSSRTWLSAGVTAGAGTLAAGYNLSGFSSAAVSGIGSSLSSGITTGDWSKSFQTGAINATGNYLGGLMAGGISEGLGTGNAYTQSLISNYTTFGMRKLLGSEESFNMGSIGDVDTINLAVQDMYKNYKQKNPVKEVKSSEKETGDKSDKFKDPFAAVDEALSGVFVSLGRGLGQTMKDIGGTIAKGAKWAIDGVSDLAGGIVTSLGNFVESTGNLFIGDGFNTDKQVEQIKEQQRLEEIRKDQNLKENQKLVDAKYGESYKEAVPETANSKAVQIIKDKLTSGKDVSEAELKAFFDSANQNSKGNTTLEKELMSTIKDDPKAFEAAMKAKGLDSSNPADVQQFSRTMQASFCVLFTEYAQMALNNVNGTAPSVGEFYKDLLNGKSSNGGKLIDILSQKVSTQEIFDSVAGKGNVDVVGYGKDRDGNGFKDGETDNGNYNGSDMMKKLKELAKSGSADYFTVRINTEGSHYHNVTLRNVNGDLRLYDNSFRGYNQSYKNYSSYLNKRTIQSFYYVR